MIFSTPRRLCSAALLVLGSLLAAPFVPGANMHAAPKATAAELQPLIHSDYTALEALYHHLHQHPELSYREEKTAARVAQELRQAGAEVTTGIGGHGVVGVLRNGPGPTVLLRTDLDALPVAEQTGAPYASRARTTNELGSEVSVMHACGHDVHMTSLVGTARLLHRLKERWQGTIVYIGQPAEERGAGARAMLRDGLFTRFPKPDYCLALHVNAEMPAGTVTAVEGFALANVDSVDITIRGVGGHGAWPHKTRDPVVLAAQTILALQTIVSRETDPIDSAVVTVGSIHGGTKHNIISDEVKLQVTVRSFSEETRKRTLESIRRIARGQALAAGIPEDRLPVVRVDDAEFTPATYNNPDLARRLNTVFRGLLGATNVPVRLAGMGGEDFSEYGRTPDKIPICMFWLGAVNVSRVTESIKRGGPLPSLHSSVFLPDAEPTIKTGVLATTAAVLDLLSK
jgi:amidohydrolase